MQVKNAVIAQQSAESIDAGVFHHDVIGVGNKDLYFYHEKALAEEAKKAEVEAKAKELYRACSGSAP